jgi:pectinesterase
MKNIMIAAFAGLLFLPQCPGQTTKAIVTVTNPPGVLRQRETIEVPLRDLMPLLGKEEAGELVVTGTGSPSRIPSQATEEELLFQSDFSPGQKKEFVVSRGGAGGAHIAPLVDGMFVLPREDYAWENDRIAFRMYGPALASEVNNGIDVWTKRVRSLVVAKWYKEAEGAPAGEDPYHHDRGEGADFFDVGRSLGAGGCSLWYEGKVRQPGVFSHWRTLSNGPLRTEFELTYNAMVIEGVKIIERMRISLDAGQNLNRIRVTYEAPEAGKRVLLACGLVKRAGTLLASDGYRGWMGLWGPTNRDSVNGSLGTGVVIQASEFVRFAQDSAQYLIIGGAVTGEPFTYYAGAGWTRSGDFATRGDWNSFLEGQAARIASPLRVACTPAK